MLLIQYRIAKSILLYKVRIDNIKGNLYYWKNNCINHGIHELSINMLIFKNNIEYEYRSKNKTIMDCIMRYVKQENLALKNQLAINSARLWKKSLYTQSN